MSIEIDRCVEVEFSSVTPYVVGGMGVFIGRLTQENYLGPSVYAAALSEYDLTHTMRGFGATRAEAVAALFNRLR